MNTQLSFKGNVPVLAAIHAIALAFTLSCSGGDDVGGGGGGGPITQTFAIKEINPDDGTFTYIEPDIDYDYRCREGGVLEKDESESYQRSAYSINGSVLELWMDAYDRDDEDYVDDSLHFNGTSSSIIGTWTRTKNKAASCKNYHCKSGYDIVKAEISQNIFKITKNLCATEEVEGHKDWRVINCNTVEMLKGNEKVTLKLEWSSKGELVARNYTYNGKTCKYKRIHTEAERKKACTEAWTKYKDEEYPEEYYWDILGADFEECVKKNNFPLWIFGGDDKLEEGSSMLMKKSNTQAPRKKNPFSIR
ncbi:MAG: hypothetical protein LBH25_06410 [Fibromonadaceae bacterium]|nr:hypothetical protein [Fibromonadaceae bacterium]